MAAAPAFGLTVFWVVRVTDHFEEMLIAPNPADILGRPSSSAAQAARGLGRDILRHQVLKLHHVAPIASEVVGIDEADAVIPAEVSEPNFGLIEHAGVHLACQLIARLRITIAETTDLEGVQVVVPPVEGGLQNEVEATQIPVDRDYEPPPDHRLDVEQLHVQLASVRGLEEHGRSCCLQRAKCATPSSSVPDALQTGRNSWSWIRCSMNLFKRLFARTKPKARPLSSDKPPSVTPSSTSVQEDVRDLTSLEDGASLRRTAKPDREEPTAPPAPAQAPDPDDVTDDDGEDPDDIDTGSEDPTLGSGETLKIDLPTPGELLDARSEAERLALAGPHRITPNDPAGPGSLAEALGRLEAEGRVYSEVVDDPDVGFYILYRPGAAGPMPHQATGRLVTE